MTTRCNLPKNLQPFLSQCKAGSVTIIRNGRNVTIPESGYIQRCSSFQAAERLVSNLIKTFSTNTKSNPRFPMMLVKEVGGKKILLNGLCVQMDRPRLLRKYDSLTTARRVFNGLDDGWRVGKWIQVTETMLGRRRRR
jgi:hypothetical protein